MVHRQIRSGMIHFQHNITIAHARLRQKLEEHKCVTKEVWNLSLSKQCCGSVGNPRRHNAPIPVFDVLEKENIPEAALHFCVFLFLT